MKSQIRSKVEDIIKDIPRRSFYTCFIDNRANGRYRMKFSYLNENVSEKQRNEIKNLSPYIVKVKNIQSLKAGYGWYGSLVIFVTIPPSSIVCKK